MFYLNGLGMVCALGVEKETIKRRVFEDPQTGIFKSDAYSPAHPLPVGRVSGPIPEHELPVVHRSRNNQLALAALGQIRAMTDTFIERFGPDRIGVIIGTSTSGIGEAEVAVRGYNETGALPDGFHYRQQELCSPAISLADALGITGPAYVQSAACASSAKALASAARLLRMKVCDAVITGGVDSLCAFTVGGFLALDSLSSERCNPLSRNRDGINIGEGAALFLMSRQPAAVILRGWGESSDGHHMSAPDPSGAGARLAIERALKCAGIAAHDIDYVNLHGTATVQNDAMEARVVHALFGDDVPVSSTKPLTGHALGAASAIEAGLCWLAMQDGNAHGILPPHLWDGIADPDLPVVNIATPGETLGRPIRQAVSNSFAFGGANAALVLGRD